MTIKPALQEILRGTLSEQKKEEEQSNKIYKGSDNKYHQKHQLYRQNNGAKFIFCSTHSKCQWTKSPNEKTQGIRMDKKTKPLYMLPTRDSSKT